MSEPRKINLPEYCVPYGESSGGKNDCDHDFPPESRRDYEYCAQWTCSICGMVATFEVLL